MSSPNILKSRIAKGAITASRIWRDKAYVMLLERDKSSRNYEIFCLSPLQTRIWELLEGKPRARRVLSDLKSKNKWVARYFTDDQLIQCLKYLIKRRLIDLAK